MNLLKFKISAPGKVILHGEHSVVYGKPALAATIGLRTHLEFCENDDVEIRINLMNLNTFFSVPLLAANNFLENLNCKFVESQFNDEILYKDLTEFLNKFCENEIIQQSSEGMALKSTFSLFFKIFFEKKLKISKAFSITVNSDLQIGAGLGSSASFNLCLAVTFLILSGQISNNSEITDKNKTLISDWALKGEMIMHLKPSGIDNTVCSFGDIIKFRKGEAFERIVLKCKLNILLVDTKVTRSTAALCEKVAQLNSEFPTITKSIFDALESLVISAIPIYENYEQNDGHFKKLKIIFQINNDLLRAIDVSHNTLEEIFTVSRKHNFGHKLTGAGGGGFAIILLPHDYKNNLDFQNLCSDLVKSNFSFFETTIGGDGIRIEHSNR